MYRMWFKAVFEEKIETCIHTEEILNNKEPNLQLRKLGQEEQNKPNTGRRRDIQKIIITFSKMKYMRASWEKIKVLKTIRNNKNI